jgi:hypothetical protein
MEDLKNDVYKSKVSPSHINHFRGYVMINVFRCHIGQMLINM